MDNVRRTAVTDVAADLSIAGGGNDHNVRGILIVVGYNYIQTNDDAVTDSAAGDIQ